MGTEEERDSAVGIRFDRLRGQRLDGISEHQRDILVASIFAVRRPPRPHRLVN